MIYKLLELKNKINRKKFSGEVVNLFTFPNVIQVQQHTELNKHKHAIMDYTVSQHCHALLTVQKLKLEGSCIEPSLSADYG